jgi:mRNA interferase MazF
MTVKRGAVVLVDYPYAQGTGSKVRPALVVQNDRDNLRLANTIVAQTTGTTRRALEPTQSHIVLNSPEGKASGLKFDSVVNCLNLLTLDQQKVLRTLGSLPTIFMQQVDACLKKALDLP